MNKVGELLAKLLAGNMLKDLTGLLDEIITNKEERLTLLNELKKEEYRHLEVIDSIKARIYEAELRYKETELNTEVELRKQAVRLATDANASWLAKNITSILALGSTITAGFIYILVLIGKLKATEPTVLLVVSNITNLVLVVFGFYFGSSVGSKLKDTKNKQ